MLRAALLSVAAMAAAMNAVIMLLGAVNSHLSTVSGQRSLVIGQSLLSSITTSTESTSHSISKHSQPAASMSKMTSFFKPKPKAPEPEMIRWTTTKADPQGTTARVKVNLNARVNGAPAARPPRAAAAGAGTLSRDVVRECVY